MNLREGAAAAVVDLVGPEARVADWLVDHQERCVGRVTRPDGGEAVVKADVDPCRTARECAVLTAARAAGIAVPVVLGYRAGPPAALVLDWVDGAWLAPERDDRAWAAVGEQLRGLHRLDVEGVDFYARSPDWRAATAAWLDDQWDMARKLGLDGVVGQVDTALVGLLGTAGPGIGTLHGDCVPIHVRLDADDRVTGLLDFGDTMRGDVAWDLAVLTLRSPRRLEAVLAGYGADAALRRWVAAAVPVYRTLRHLTEAVWLADHGHNPAASVRATALAAERLAP